jgi:hypothetical protein
MSTTLSPDVKQLLGEGSLKARNTRRDPRVAGG